MAKKVQKKVQELSEEEVALVRSVIDNEGFDYAFRSYSDFAEVENKHFHKLRKAYIEAAEALEDFVGEDEVDYNVGS